jgi:hypothetical protein
LLLNLCFVDSTASSASLCNGLPIVGMCTRSTTLFSCFDRNGPRGKPRNGASLESRSLLYRAIKLALRLRRMSSKTKSGHRTAHGFRYLQHALGSPQTYRPTDRTSDVETSRRLREGGSKKPSASQPNDGTMIRPSPILISWLDSSINPVATKQDFLDQIHVLVLFPQVATIAASQKMAALLWPTGPTTVHVIVDLE